MATSPKRFRITDYEYGDWVVVEEWQKKGQRYKQIFEGHSLDWDTFAEIIGFKDFSTRTAIMDAEYHDTVIGYENDSEDEEE